MKFGKLRGPLFKGERWIIAFFAFAGICLGVADAVVDSILFTQGSFSKLMFNMSAHEFYIRTLFLISFVVFGIFIAGLMARRRADAEALREAFEQAEGERAKTSAIIAALGDGISIQSTDFRVLYQNRTHEELVGGSKVGKFCYEAYAGRDAVCPECAVDKSFREGGIYRHERNRRTAMGNRHLEIVASPLKDSSGRIVAGIEIVRDITARKDTENKLREAHSHIETLLEAIPYAAFFKDAEGRHVVVNEATRKFIGLPRGEILGRTAEEILPPNIAEVCRKSDNASLEAKKTSRSEETFTDGEGNPHIFETIKTPLLDKDGNIQGLVGLSYDITERKKTDMALRELKERYQRVVDDLPDLICRYRPDTVITFVNKLYAEYFGRTVGELVGTSFLSLIPPEDHDYVVSKIASLSLESPAVEMEHKVIAPDGKLRWHLWRDHALFDGSGNVIEIQSIGQDITERKLMENELSRKEEMFSQMAENINEVFWLFDCTEQRVLYASPAYEEIWGRPVKDLYARYEEWGESVHPEDREFAEKSFLRIMETGGGEDRDYRIVRPDGTVRWISDKGYAIHDKDGKVRRIAGTAEDITERKKAEEKLREYREHLEEMVRGRTAELTSAIELLKEQIDDGYRTQQFIINILESIDESLIVIDPEYRVISANRSFCEHVGLSLEEAKGKHCYELLHQRNHPCFVVGENCSARRVFISGEPATSMHAHYRGEESIFVETKSYPMKDSNGKIASVIQVINDITEKRRLEEQLRHSQKMEAIGQLAGGVAHDFNNRLAAIMNYAYIVKTKLSPDDPMLVHVNQILSSSERAAHLTQNLLTFSRKHFIDPRPMRLNDVVSRVEKLLARVIGEDIELATELSSDELVVMADGDQLEHVLINLATNARDAMPGSGQVSIRTARAELGRQFFEGRGSARPGSYAMIEFRDSGAGMDSKTREKVFEPFFTTKEVGRGTGLGLSMVYGIIKQHNGYITVDSSLGRGTSFNIYLPLLTTQAEQSDEEELTVPDKGNETVLLVEDDEDVRKPVRQMLEGYGYEVIEAVDGKDAIEKFLHSRKKIGLLMLDVILPGLNGVEVLKEIKKVEPGIRAIFTSGYSEEHIRSKGLVASGTKFLSKPVLPEVLLQAVRDTLDN